MLEKYLLKAISLGLDKELLWLRTILGKPTISNKYYNVEKGVYTLEEETFKLSSPLLASDTKVKIEIEGKIKTVTGFRYIANIIYIERPFNGKIPFQDKSFTYNDIYYEYIVDDLLAKKGISIDEYRAFMKAIVFTHPLAPLIVHTETVKTITPPPGIVAYKKKLIQEYKDKYGDDVLKDELKTLEIDNKLKAFDAKYMEDDPTMDIVTNKKIMNVSRKNKFISIGKPTALIPTTETGYIEESLTEGKVLDIDKIVAVNNAIRYGSASRGIETQLTGLIAKYLSAATRGFKISSEDCKVKKGYKVKIDEVNILFINNIRFDTKGVLIQCKVNDVVEMRDYMYCAEKGNNFCKKCVGILASGTYNPVILKSITTGGQALSGSLGKFHAVVKDITIIETGDLFT